MEILKQLLGNFGNICIKCGIEVKHKSRRVYALLNDKDEIIDYCVENEEPCLCEKCFKEYKEKSKQARVLQEEYMEKAEALRDSENLQEEFDKLEKEFDEKLKEILTS